MPEDFKRSVLTDDDCQLMLAQCGAKSVGEFLTSAFVMRDIRDKRLWRGEADSWEQYCEHKFGSPSWIIDMQCADAERIHGFLN